MCCIDIYYYEMEEIFEIVNNSVILLYFYIGYFIYIFFIVINFKYLKIYYGFS